MGVKTPPDRAALPNSGSFGVDSLFTALSEDDRQVFMSLSHHLLVNADKFSRNATDTAFFRAKKCSVWSLLFLIETGGLGPRRLAARQRSNLAALRRIGKVLWFKTQRL